MTPSSRGSSAGSRALRRRTSPQNAATPTTNTTALHACVWALLDYFQGKREAAVDCVRSAAKAIMAGRAKTTVTSEGDAFRFLGNVVREFMFGDGDNPWFVEEDGEVRVSQGAHAATN